MIVMHYSTCSSVVQILYYVIVIAHICTYIVVLLVLLVANTNTNTSTIVI